MDDRIISNKELGNFVLASWPARQKLVKINLDRMLPTET